MKFSAIGIKRRFKGLFRKAAPATRGVAPAAGLEPLEQRVLLSAAGLAELPDVNRTVSMGRWGTYEIDLPGVTNPSTPSAVSGLVFRDLDADGWQDPDEHSLKRVTVFADLDGDGRWGVDDATAATGSDGTFSLTGLPDGTFDVRVLMPNDYKAGGAESATVTVSSSRGVGGLRLGIVPTGFDLGMELSDVSMPDQFQTGTRVTVPVLVTNRGNTFMPAGDIKLRVFVSEDGSRSDDDIRLTTFALTEGLKPGASAKVEIEVDLPDALADFSSYLIVDAVGKTLRNDLDRGDNSVVSQTRLSFKASDEPTSLGVDQFEVVLGTWKPSTPYGGLAPGYGYGDGFVGIDDLNVVLGNWNAGTPAPPRVYYPIIRSLVIEGGYLVSGEQNRITVDGVTAEYGRLIDRVMFFYDADRDGTIDDVLGVDTDGSDGYSIVADLNATLLQSDGGKVIAVARDDAGYLGGISEYAETRLAVTVNAGQTLVYREADGTVVELSLTGRGSAQVRLSGSRIRAWDLGDTIEITGNAEAEDIALNRTTGRSKLRIKTDRAGEHELGTVIKGKITGSTPLGLLAANGVDLTGGIHMTGRGAIRAIKANSIRGIDMPGETFGNGVSITAGKITGKVTLGSKLRLLDVGELSDVRMVTPSAERIRVERDFEFSTLALTDADAALSLGLLRVGNRMRGVQVHASSLIDTIRARSMVNSQVQVGGSTWAAAPASLASVGAKNGKIKNLIVEGAFARSYVTAWRIGQVSLNRVGPDTASGPNGLYYRRLGRYDGPDSLDRTVI